MYESHVSHVMKLDLLLPPCPVSDRLLQIIKVAFEEMARVSDDLQLNIRIMLFDLGHQFLQPRQAAKFIPVAMDKQYRLATSGEKAEVILVDGRTNADQINNALIRNTNFQADAGDKGETTKCDWSSGKGLSQIM